MGWNNSYLILQWKDERMTLNFEKPTNLVIDQICARDELLKIYRTNDLVSEANLKN